MKKTLIIVTTVVVVAVVACIIYFVANGRMPLQGMKAEVMTGSNSAAPTTSKPTPTPTPTTPNPYACCRSQTVGTPPYCTPSPVGSKNHPCASQVINGTIVYDQILSTYNSQSACTQACPTWGEVPPPEPTAGFSACCLDTTKDPLPFCVQFDPDDIAKSCPQGSTFTGYLGEATDECQKNCIDKTIRYNPPQNGTTGSPLVP